MLTVRICSGETPDGLELALAWEVHDSCFRGNRCSEPDSVLMQREPLWSMVTRKAATQLTDSMYHTLVDRRMADHLEGPDVARHNLVHFEASQPRMF